MFLAIETLFFRAVFETHSWSAERATKSRAAGFQVTSKQAQLPTQSQLGKAREHPTAVST